MKPLQRVSVPLWSLLVFSALLKIPKAECVIRECNSNETETLTTTTTTITIGSQPNCNFSIGTNTSENGSITGLIPGTVYQIFLSCFNCCKEVATKPKVVKDLHVAQIAPSRVFLNWTEPEGKSSFFRIQVTNGKSNLTLNTNETFLTITSLTAGVKHNITVCAVAEDGHTEGEKSTYLLITKPETVRNLSVTEITTSSLFLTWTEPDGNSSFYKVQWSNGNFSETKNVSQTNISITDLTPGLQYTVTVTAVADDGLTEGQSTTVTQYTRPGKIGNLTVDTNTSSISLNWASPHGDVLKYKVEWSIGEALMARYTYDSSVVLSNLIPGTTYTISIIAVVGDNQTGEAYIFTSVTKPSVVRSLSITEVTTSSVSLNWTEPEGNATSYAVQWTVGGVTSGNKTTETSFIINDLIPGSKYNITVAAVAVNSTGERASITTFTKPEKPGNITLTARGTDSLTIHWTLPKGNFEHFVVNISNEELTYFYSNISTASTANFTDLHPGRMFVVTVTAVAGSFSDTSEQASFGTYPTSPGSIIISQKTNSSLHLKWATPAGMDGAPHISYHVTYQSDGGKVLTGNSTVNNTVLSLLSSGTFYNITLETVGPQNLRSMVVHTSAFTLPNPVLNLAASPKTTTSVEVKWSYPQGAQPYYKYFVQTYNGALINTTVNTSSTDIPNLEPGTKYHFNVTTIAATGSESIEEQTFSYTMPKAVTNLSMEHVNTTAIQLTWLRQSDHKNSYLYLVMARQDAVVVRNDSTETETYTFFHLTPGEFYTFDVFTVIEGVRSRVNSISSYTKPAAVSGITVIGSTTNLSVSWRPAPGQVDSYIVRLYRDSQLEESKNLSNNAVNELFLNLTPGVRYCVAVVTKSGTFETNSSRVCNATFPNPPGLIMVESQSVESINFTWPSPENMDYQQYNFSVSSFNGSSLTENNWFLLDNLQSGSLYNISVVTVGMLDYESTAVTAGNYTRPYPVTMLRQSEVTTYAITLVWEQQESKSFYSYVVQASNGSIFLSKTVNTTTITISGLVAGSNYSFTVTTQTADGTQAAPVTVSYFTQPEAVQPSISSHGSNSSLLVSWSEPRGKVEHYVVELNGTSPAEKRVLSTVNTSCLFENLSAGRLYSARVTTYSGPLNASSGFVSNATFPNPPGLITIPMKTTSSIDIQWEEAPLMINTSFQYRLTITSPEGEVCIPGTNNSHSFASLLSGTSYKISVATVGAMGFESLKVKIPMVTTRPFSVKNLSASTEEENITVMWVKPQEYKESYSYHVIWNSSDGPNSFVTRDTQYNISNLVPGRHYNLSVTTETSDGTQGTPRWISRCTNASPVKDLQCEGPNKTNAEITVSWSSPNGQHSGFRVAVNDNKTINLTNTCCNHTVSNLLHYTVYKLTVETLSCGQASTSRSRKCRTGITNPPVPEAYKSLVAVSQKTHNKFTLQIDSRLLNNTNGPITHVGVLVTSKLPGDISNWRKYLGNTYDHWTAKNTSVYLATVTNSIFQSHSGESNLTLEVGDESKWEGYTNGILVTGGKYQYAVVVFTSLSLQNSLVNVEESLVSRTNFYLPVELLGDPAVPGIAIGATLGIFFILSIILVGFIVYWRRLSNKEQTDIQIHSMRAKVSVAVRMEDYEVYYKKQKADSNCGFAEEFEDLKPVGTGQLKTNALILENKPKNRYNNVLPYDSSRVKLSIIHGSPYDDYINANYIPGYNSKKEFIAAQGPLPATVKEFWRMIWEKNVQTLVMLTRCNEQGRVKCEQYWDFGTKHFENITVTATSEIPLEDWTIRDFDIKNVKTAETRSVRHFHFTAWPDHGVPETTELLISFRHLVREHMDQYSRHSPTVVHCSAGVGRTGTFIAIDRLIFQIERENIVDVYGIVHDLRMHRPLMVQTEDQYVFLNQCAMDIIRSRTGTNVDLIYQNTAALSIYENVEPKKGYRKKGYHNA